MMDRTLRFLQEAKTFFVATTEGDQPRVRPFGAICKHNGKLYICTNNQKKVFKQMQKNPNVEICATIGRTWLRLSGVVAVDPSKAAKQAMLDANPNVQKMYTADDGLFEVLYFKSGTATFYSMASAPETETLY